MECIDVSFKAPEENIAFDELLLSQAERGQKGKTLRFWELQDYVAVLGRGASVSDDVFVGKCRKDNVKIIQRISGGGTVLLGKGCVNYSLILPYNANANLLNIKSSFRYILGSIATAFQKKGLELTHYPVSDLAINGKKVSGNAQARKRRFLLHHGTFLYNFDIDRVGFYLKEPKKVPEYRNGRAHKDFLANLPLSDREIKQIIKDCFASLTMTSCK